MISTPISIVIPVFEEAGNIGQLNTEIESALDECESLEVVFVDDGSRDGTAAALERLQNNGPVTVVCHETRMGQSAALHSGVRHAAWDRIVTLDGDGQNDPADIPALLAMASNCERGERGLLVIGNRIHRRDSWIRKASSRIANGVRKRVLGDDTPDTGCGIKTFRRTDFLRLPYFDHMHRFLPALFLRSGGHVVSVEVNHRPRRSGRSKYGVNDRLWSGIVDMLGVWWLMRRHPKTEEGVGKGGKGVAEKGSDPISGRNWIRPLLHEIGSDPFFISDPFFKRARMSLARRDLVWLLAATLLILGSGLGLKDPWPPDAPRFALIARDMLATGDWLIPRVGGVIYADKPPLFMWLQASAMWITGSLRVGYLLPALLAGLGTIWLVHDLACRLWGREAALSAGVALLITLQFPLTFKAGQIDPLLCFLTTLSLYGLLRHLLLGPSWAWYAGGFFAAGLGVTTKGVGFLPLLILLPWMVAVKRGWCAAPGGRSGRWALGPIAFFVAIGLWLIPLLIYVSGSGDPELIAYRDEILLRQTVERYTNPWGHQQPPWFFVIEVIPLLWFPTVLLFPWLISCWRSSIDRKDPAIFLLLAWIVLVVAFFSISGGKRGVYILPAVPALALTVGCCLPELYQRGLVHRLAIAVFMLTMVVLAVMYVGPPFGILESAGPNAAVYQNVAGSWLIVALLCLAVCRFRQAVTGLVVFTLIVWVTAGWVVIPLANEKRSGRLILPAAEAVLPPGGTLGLLHWKEQFLLYADRPLVHFGYRRKTTTEPESDAVQWLSDLPSNRLLLSDDDFEPCFSPRGAIELGYAHRHRWFLIGPDAIQPDCRGRGDTSVLLRYTPTAL